MTLSTHLVTLETSGLVRLTQSEPELEYLFRHALIQDAAYSSLLKADRRVLHRTVGEALERMYPDQLDELAPVLAAHFAEAGEDERALHYFTRAGDEAARVYANAEAIMHYTRAIASAKRHSPISNSLISNLYLNRGRALELNAHYDEALANYMEMEALALEHHEAALQLAALMQRATLHSTSTPHYNFALAEELSAQCLELARALGDRAAEARILWNRMNLYRFSGHMQRAIECGERALALARELGTGTPNVREQLAFILNDMTHVHVATGLPGQWRVTLAEATALWRELNNRPMLADSLATASLYHTMMGHYAEAMAASEEACAISQAIDNAWGKSYSLSFVGRAYWDYGEVTRAMAVMAEGVRWGDISGFVVAQTQTRADLGGLYGTLGAYPLGFDHVRQAIRAAQMRMPVFEAYAVAAEADLYVLNDQFDLAAEYLARAEQLSRTRSHPLVTFALGLSQARFALAQGRSAEVLAIIETGLSTLYTIGFASFIPEALYLRGMALWQSDQPALAETALQAARAAAEAIGSRRMLWPILAALAEIETRHGHPAEAATLRAEAHAHLTFIADHCPPELRESFLNLPNVRAVTQAA